MMNKYLKLLLVLVVGTIAIIIYDAALNLNAEQLETTVMKLRGALLMSFGAVIALVIDRNF